MSFITPLVPFAERRINMVESLIAARQEFDDDIIVSYSDILFEEDMLRKMMECGEDFAAAVDDNWQEYWKARYKG